MDQASLKLLTWRTHCLDKIIDHPEWLDKFELVGGSQIEFGSLTLNSSFVSCSYCIYYWRDIKSIQKMRTIGSYLDPKNPIIALLWMRELVIITSEFLASF